MALFDVDQPMTLHLHALAAFNDNYIWLLEDRLTQRAALVDPGDAEVAQRWFDEHPTYQLESILITHHHRDHTGGLSALIERHRPQVFAPHREAIAGCTQPLLGDCLIEVLGQPIQVLSVPGHTRGHLAYYQPQLGWLFSGDCLFLAGCGRIFEGTAEQMFHSLQKLAALPPSTQVFCAHEYSLSNLRFAAVCEPDNIKIQNHLRQIAALRESSVTSLPSTLADELECNPFLRATGPYADLALDQQFGKSTRDALTRFSQLRQWKNIF